MGEGVIYSISTSPQKKQLKTQVVHANVIAGHGLENDAHAGPWGRQVTCLDLKSVQETNRRYGLKIGPGDFAENILIDGLDLSKMSKGSRLKLGKDVILEVTQVGKEEDPNDPSIVQKTFGISLLPKEGLFCKVLAGGKIKKGDIVVPVS